METVRIFDSLVSSGKFQEASIHLTDDFEWIAPNKKLDKVGWLGTASKTKCKDLPVYGDFEHGSNKLQVTRKGTKRILMMTVSLIQTLELTEDGKIRQISVAKV